MRRRRSLPRTWNTLRRLKGNRPRSGANVPPFRYPVMPISPESAPSMVRRYGQTISAAAKRGHPTPCVIPRSQINALVFWCRGLCTHSRSNPCTTPSMANQRLPTSHHCMTRTFSEKGKATPPPAAIHRRFSTDHLPPPTFLNCHTLLKINPIKQGKIHPLNR